MALRSKVQYDCLEVKDITIPNTVTTSDVARTLTGFTMNNGVALCIKKSNYADESILFRIDKFVDEIGNAQPNIKKKEIPCASRGMAYDDLHLYIATGSDMVVRIPTSMTNNQVEKVKVKSLDGTVFNSTAITKRANGKFTLMGNGLNVGTDFLCFANFVFDEGTMTLTEEPDSRFYVKNTGYSRIRDIYYNAKYGLFIVTNKMNGSSYTTNNLILRVDFGRVDADRYEGCKLYYPAAEYSFDGDPNVYTQLSVESVYINPADSKMYVATNAVLKDGTITADDSIWHVGNLRFYKDEPFYAKVYVDKRVSIPVIEVDSNNGLKPCNNPGAFVLDDNDKGYCISSFTSTDETEPDGDKLSVLLKTEDIDRINFTRVGKTTYTNLGHANGLAYYNNELYVASYSKQTDILQKTTTKMSLTGENLVVYNTDTYLGAISHYKDNRFILADYAGDYALNPKFYIGYFDNASKKFISTESFKVINPAYVPGAKNFLQDLHYDPKYGLYFGTRCAGEDYLCRVTAENVEKAIATGGCDVDEKYAFSSSFNELESVCISKTGRMYVVEGVAENALDALDLVTTLRFFE